MARSGLTAVVFVGYSFLALFNPRPVLELQPSSPRLGQSIHVQWRMRGNGGRINRLDIVLEGSEEAEIVDRLSVATPEPSGERRFSFKAPEGPYSFSGRLITLRWALELVLEPSKDVERLDLIVSPRPVEVDIRHIREL